MTESIPKINVLGIGISTLTLSEAIEVFESWVVERQKGYVSVCTVHTVMECQYDTQMREAVGSADIATPDGMPLVWLGKWKGERDVTRVYGPDLMLALCERSQTTGARHYFYGGSDSVLEDLVNNLTKQFPLLQLVGAYSPPFRSLTEAEKKADIKRVNDANPDFVWVGLGTPKQDLWMAENRSKLNAAALFGVGAAFDFHAGRKAQAPKWMQRNGLEWLFRLLTEPKRLWKRYLVYNPLFIYKVILQSLKIQKFPLN